MCLPEHDDLHPNVFKKITTDIVMYWWEGTKVTWILEVPEEWKTANVMPLFKEGGSQMVVLYSVAIIKIFVL